MKRSRQVSLALVSTIPFALTACDSGEQTKTVTNSKTFATIQECVDSKVPVDICSQSYIMALNEHRKVAPSYASEDDCEADFVKDYCVQSAADNQWMPKLGGFQITESHDVKYRKNADGQYVPVQPQVQTMAASTGAYEGQTTQTTSGGGGGTTIINNNTGGGGHGSSGAGDFLTGMLVGHALSGNGGSTNNYHYHSEPVYQTRDSRGDYRTSTISERVNSGSDFKASNQAKSGYDYKQKSITDSLSNRSAPAARTTGGSSYWGSSSSSSTSANSASVSRGGFGSQSVARSSWGGSSSFGG
jgi:uncharacterized protein YgiB involved in biofilm formation